MLRYGLPWFDSNLGVLCNLERLIQIQQHRRCSNSEASCTRCCHRGSEYGTSLACDVLLAKADNIRFFSQHGQLQ
jgi:hypothetical protein